MRKLISDCPTIVYPYILSDNMRFYFVRIYISNPLTRIEWLQNVG